MSASSKPKTDTAEQFVGSVFKFSISTVATIVIGGLVILLEGFLFPTDADKSIYGEIQQFIRFTNIFMTIAIFGLDQSFIRFFNEPPGRLKSGGLFRLCVYLSTSVLVVGGLICSLFLMDPLYSVLNFNHLGREVIPLMFLNAFFWMVARYFYVLYRMEQSVKMYTITAILMNFFYKLFHMLGMFFEDKALAMMIFSMIGLGGFALFSILMRRRILVPRREDLDPKALRTILPYGLAVAPTAIIVTLNTVFGSVYMSHLDAAARGLYNYGNNLSTIVTMVQGGFASFWGAYMYANYKKQQPRIKRVHGYLYLLILVFFSLLVGFEDVLFWILRGFADVQPIFPMMMLSAVFTILCETTVYGITIARRPIFDTIGNALGIATNIILCIVLIPRFELVGAAMAIAGANFVMYVFRTIIAQMFYVSINSVPKTIIAVQVAIALALAGTLFTYDFWPKLLCSAIAIAIYCIMYRAELVRFWNLGLGILKSLFGRKGGGGSSSSGPATRSDSSGPAAKADNGGWRYHKED